MTSADLFIFLVSTFLSDFEVFSNKRNDCLAQDSNLGPLACEASVLPFCHGDLIDIAVKSWVFELFENLPVTTFFVGNKQSHFLPYLSVCYFSVRSRSIFFDLTDLDRPRTKPTRPRSIFDRNRPFFSQ